MKMFRVFVHDGTQHAIPIDNRTAEDLALQLSHLFGQGASVLSMRLTNEPDAEDLNKRSRGRQRKTA